jgi:hypothetical protein
MPRSLTTFDGDKSMASLLHDRIENLIIKVFDRMNNKYSHLTVKSSKEEKLFISDDEYCIPDVITLCKRKDRKTDNYYPSIICEVKVSKNDLKNSIHGKNFYAGFNYFVVPLELAGYAIKYLLLDLKREDVGVLFYNEYYNADRLQIAKRSHPPAFYSMGMDDYVDTYYKSSGLIVPHEIMLEE